METSLRQRLRSRTLSLLRPIVGGYDFSVATTLLPAGRAGPVERRRVRTLNRRVTCSFVRFLFISNALGRSNIKVLIIIRSIVAEVLGAHTPNIRSNFTRTPPLLILSVHSLAQYVPIC